MTAFEKVEPKEIQLLFADVCSPLSQTTKDHEDPSPWHAQQDSLHPSIEPIAAIPVHPKD